MPKGTISFFLASFLPVSQREWKVAPSGQLVERAFLKREAAWLGKGGAPRCRSVRMWPVSNGHTRRLREREWMETLPLSICPKLRRETHFVYKHELRCSVEGSRTEYRTNALSVFFQRSPRDMHYSHCFEKSILFKHFLIDQRENKIRKKLIS